MFPPALPPQLPQPDSVDLRDPAVERLRAAYQERLVVLASAPLDANALAANDALIAQLENSLRTSPTSRTSTAEPSHWWG